MINIAMKFKDLENDNNGSSTAKEHIDVLQKKGAVIWGCWSNKIMPEKTYQDLKKEVPFYCYALDRTTALLKMRVIRVLTKEEIINEKLEYLIPSYYGLNKKCSVYYLIDEFSVTSPDNGEYVKSQNGTPLSFKGAINSATPWRYGVTVETFSMININHCDISQEEKIETNKFGIPIAEIKKERAKVTNSLRYQVLKRDNFTCQACGRTINDNVKLHIDHIIPVAKGGKSVLNNLQVLCEECNLGKGVN